MLNVKKLLTKLMYRTCGGAFPVGNVSGGSYKDLTVTFDKAFSAVPSVVVCLNSNSISPNMGLVTAAVLSRSTTGFSVRVFNADSSGRSPYIDWVATASWGGYCINLLLSTASRLAERRWGYAEREEADYKDALNLERGIAGLYGERRDGKHHDHYQDRQNRTAVYELQKHLSAYRQSRHHTRTAERIEAKNAGHRYSSYRQESGVDTTERGWKLLCELRGGIHSRHDYLCVRDVHIAVALERGLACA